MGSIYIRVIDERLLNIQTEDIVTYKNCLSWIFESFKFEHHFFCVPTEMTADVGNDKFNSQKHVRFDDKHFDRPKLTYTKSLCPNFEKNFFEAGKRLELHKAETTLNWTETRCKTVWTGLWKHGFWQTKERRKTVEGLAEVDLKTPTHSDWAVPGIWDPKKDRTYRLVVDYLRLSKQKKVSGFFRKLIMSSCLSKIMCFPRALTWLQGFFKWLWKKKN